MNRHLIAISLIASGLFAAGCSAGAPSPGGPDSPPETATSVEVSPSEPPADAGAGVDANAPQPSSPKDGGSDAADASATQSPRGGPAWMIGTLEWSEWSGGDLESDFLELAANGTGNEVTQTLRPNIPYNAGDQIDRESFVWWSDGKQLVTQTKLFEIDAMTPNCRLLEIDTRVYTHTPPSGTCPRPMPALTTLESARVGDWSWSEAATSNASAAYLRIKLGADRHIEAHAQPHVPWVESLSDYDQDWTDYYLTDGDGTIHGTNPRGVEELTIRLTDAPNGLQFCYNDGMCVVLTK